MLKNPHQRALSDDFGNYVWQNLYSRTPIMETLDFGNQPILVTFSFFSSKPNPVSSFDKFWSIKRKPIFILKSKKNALPQWITCNKISHRTNVKFNISGKGRKIESYFSRARLPSILDHLTALEVFSGRSKVVMLSFNLVSKARQQNWKRSNFLLYTLWDWIF